MTNKTVKIWAGGGETATCTLTINDEGFGIINGAARKAFTCGQCHALALALHQLTGGTIKGTGRFQWDTPDSPAHCVVYVSSSRVYVDINGIHRKPPYGDKIVNRCMSPKWVRSLDGYLKPDVKAAIPFAKSILRRFPQVFQKAS